MIETVPEDQRKDRDAIESALGEYCKRGKNKLNSKERKACYYMVDIKRKVADPLARGLPASRVCKKLKKANQELCEMRFRAFAACPSHPQHPDTRSHSQWHQTTYHLHIARTWRISLRYHALLACCIA